MARGKSRPERWAEAIEAAKKAVDAVRDAQDALKAPFEELDSLREEYEQWRDNMSENLQSSRTYEMCDEIANMDFQIDTDTMSLDEIEQVLDEAEGAELPRGFGRD